MKKTNNSDKDHNRDKDRSNAATNNVAEKPVNSQNKGGALSDGKGKHIEHGKDRTRKSSSLIEKVMSLDAPFTSVVLSGSQIKALVRKDFPTNNKKNFDVDCYTCFVALNTWCFLSSDITGIDASTFASHIKLYGIKHCINEAEDFRQSILHQDNTNDLSELSPFWHDILSRSKAITWDQLNTMLGQLRRLKIEAIDHSDMAVAFLESNQRCGRHNKDIFDSSKDMTWDEYKNVYLQTPQFLIGMARECICSIFQNWKQDESLFTLPPGTAYGYESTYLEKFDLVLSNQTWLRDRGVRIPHTFGCGPDLKPSRCNRWSVVPKNFKTGRGIAPEPVSRQVLGYQVDAGMRQCLRAKAGIDLNNQEINQNATREAFSRGLTTVDLSAASDSISFFLVEQLLKGTPLYDRLIDCRTEYINVKGTIVQNHRFSTMGNAITFSLESAIFLSIATCAYILYEHGEGRDHTFKWYWNRIYVYGDDIIIPDEVYPILLDIMPLFGFTINTSKTFSKGSWYRESCGCEMIHPTFSLYDCLPVDSQPVECTGTYWPRGLSSLPIAELVDLQHKYCNFFKANSFLMSVILEVFPGITTSERGSQYSDIWVSGPCYRRRGRSPYAIFRYSLDLKVEPEPQRGLQLYNPEGSEGETVNTEIFYDYGQCLDVYRRSYHKVRSQIRKQLFTLEDPCSDDYELHTSVSAVQRAVIRPRDVGRVELLMYLLTIGKGIEHINSSDYTKPEAAIADKRDLVASRQVTISQKYYLR